nr:carboxypeptidase regulatory-like domain-containing protein [Planctomycetota bacterium]
MKSLLCKTAFSLTAIALVFTTSSASAQSLRKAASQNVVPQKSARQAPQRAMDVKLSSRGVFAGYVLDAQGRPMANEPVLVRQGIRRVAQTRTDASGQFRVARMRGGVYQVVIRKSSSMFRVWTPSAAPKGARQ